MFVVFLLVLKEAILMFLSCSGALIFIGHQFDDIVQLYRKEGKSMMSRLSHCPEVQLKSVTVGVN